MENYDSSFNEIKYYHNKTLTDFPEEQWGVLIQIFPNMIEDLDNPSLELQLIAVSDTSNAHLVRVIKGLLPETVSFLKDNYIYGEDSFKLNYPDIVAKFPNLFLN